MDQYSNCISRTLCKLSSHLSSIQSISIYYKNNYTCMFSNDTLYLSMVIRYNHMNIAPIIITEPVRPVISIYVISIKTCIDTCCNRISYFISITCYMHICMYAEVHQKAHAEGIVIFSLWYIKMEYIIYQRHALEI